MHPHAQPTGTPPVGGGGRASIRLIIRLARRDIARHRARAALVILLIALPVAMTSGLCTIWSSDQASTGVAASTEQTFGDADIVVGPINSWDGRCTQDEHLASLACKDDVGTKETPAADLKRQQQALTSVRLSGVTLEPVRTVSTAVNWRGLQLDTAIVAADQFRLRTAQMTLPEGATAMPGKNEIWINAEAARRYDWGVGRTIRINGADYQVVGLSRAGSSPSVQIWVGPGSPLAEGGDLTWFGTGRAPSFAEAAVLNRQGLAVMVRKNYAEWGAGGGDSASIIAATFGVGALAALVTATIAGAAFAIGARQQRRTLALLGATGADRRVLRRLVTGQGVLLGGIGAVLGAGLGVTSAIGVVAWRNLRTTTYPDPIGVPWLMAVGAIVIGVIAATVAAWFPAHAVAKQDVLAGVRNAETASRPARFPWIGLALVVAGVTVGAWGAVRFHRLNIRPVLDDLTGAPVAPAGTQDLYIPVIACIVLLFIGVVISLPRILGAVARPSAGGRLAPRFALRDLARNRGRAVACIAASMAAMALFSAVLTMVDCQDRADLRNYAPSLPEDVAAIGVDDPAQQPLSPQMAADEMDAVKNEFGTVTNSSPERRLMRCTDATGDLPAPGSNTLVHRQTSCDDALEVIAEVSEAVGSSATKVEVGDSSSYAVVPVAVDDGSLYRVLTGRAPDRQVLRALDNGVVVFNPKLAPHGRTTVRLSRDTQADDQVTQRDTAIPAMVSPEASGSGLPVLIGRASAARIAGLRPGTLDLRSTRTWLRLPAAPTQAQADRVNAEIARATSFQNGFVYESGHDRTGLLILRWGALVAAVLTLTVAVVVLALSLSDSRPARSALAAVGSSTGTLRWIAAVQATITVGIGGVIGALVGAAPMAMAAWGSGPSMVVAVPWGYLAALALGIPLLVGVGVRVFVPAARPVLRRRD